jgi:N-acetylglucosaminyldiphosphoundecaprenol N-acetyl-beta-D-mannosaminyltransferase
VDNTAILAIDGRLTIENYQSFYEIGHKALAVTPNLVINLAQADFLDSSAIGLLIELSRQARENGGELWLASASPDIERTLSILHLDKFFLFSPTVEQVFQQKGIILQTKMPVTAEFEPLASLAESQPNWNVIKLPRRVDALTAPEMIDSCEATLAHSPHLVLDLTDTVFLASAGLAALSRLNRAARDFGGELRVANCTKDVLKVIEMVRFDKILAIYPDIPTALK